MRLLREIIWCTATYSCLYFPFRTKQRGYVRTLVGMDIKCADSDLGKQGRLDRHCTIVIRDPASKPSPPFVSPYHTPKHVR